MVDQPVKQQGELLEILVDRRWALAGVQQLLLELDHVHFAVVSDRSITQRLDKGTDVVLLVAELFRCPREGLLFLIPVTQDRQERSSDLAAGVIGWATDCSCRSTVTSGLGLERAQASI